MDKHRMNNHLNLIRMECESLILESQEGFTKALSKETYEQKVLTTLSHVIDRVDEISQMITSSK